jgi:hypothetical protein
MRALSIEQPWAEMILHHGKCVENRSWNTKLRGYLAIHASKARRRTQFEDTGVDADAVAFGAIVGFARLTDVITRRQVTRRTAKWFRGEYGLLLDDVIPLETPVKATGALGFWQVKPGALRACLDQLTGTDRAKLERGPVLGERGRATWLVKARVDRNGHNFIEAGTRAPWVTRKPPKDWAVGDTLLFWKTAPHSCLIGAGELVRIDQRDRRGDTFFRVEYRTNHLPNPVPDAELRRDAFLRGASFLKSGPAGTLFVLTSREARRLASLALDLNAGQLSAKESRLYQELAARP